MLTAGFRLGPYEIRSLIGAGGMGEVYRAHDTRLRRDVAVKVLPATFAADPTRLQRFEREARAAAALSHPNIVTLYDVGEQGGVLFVVSEYVEGQTLRGALAAGSLPPRRAVGIAIQVARGLAAAHARGQVHRDLKPENILLTPAGEAKILDFGLVTKAAGRFEDAQTATALTDAGLIVGTIGYMSPEQLRGLPVDGRSDLFAFGVVVYEMLAGRSPFRRVASADAISAVLNDDPPPLSDNAPQIPRALERIVAHCLEKSPENRYQSADDVAFHLESLSTLSGSDNAAPPARRAFGGRTIATFAGAALAMLAAGVAAGHVFWRSALEAPGFQRLTFRAGTVFSAKFTPDGQTVVYSAAWHDAPVGLFTTRMDSHESRSLDVPGSVLLSMSSRSEMALLIHPQGLVAGLGGTPGTLARMPVAGGASREVLNDVVLADWTPDGNNLAVVHSVSGQHRLELPIGHVIYETPNNLLAMRVSPDGRRVALAEHAPGFGTDGLISVVDRSGTRTVLAQGELGDFADVAWAPAGREIWYDFGIAGGQALRAVDLDGHRRTLFKLPGRFQLFDISQTGRLLINKTNWRVSVYGEPPGAAAERDYSWLDASEVDDVTPDGRTLLITEFGDGGDPRLWSVYVRKTDDSPAVRLGDGQAMSISPDGSRVLALARTDPPQLVVYPTGVGEPITIPSHAISDYFMAVWLSDGRHVLFTGVEPGQGQKCYVESIDGAEFRAVGAEACTLPLAEPAGVLSPDGRLFVGIGDDHVPRLFPVAGGAAPRPIPGIRAWDTPLRWSADGKALYVAKLGELPVRVDRLDVASGVRQTLRTLMPAEPAGVQDLYAVQIAADRGWYFYSCWRVLSDLYAAEGVK